MTDPAVSCSIDLSAPGKQIGHLALPKITNTAGWASTFVHIASIARGEGPTVLVLAGNHGDEYEGQVAAMRLLQELQPETVHGRVIVVPGPLPRRLQGRDAQLALRRQLQPLVPGRPDGPPNEQLADFLTRVLFPLADVVIDMHSGGRSAWFIPCSHMHVVDDPVQRKAMLEGMEAWNSDWHFLYIDVNGTGLLPVEAENQGKVVITTELGGGGRVPAPIHRLAWSGLSNVLRHVGVLEGEVETRASLGLPPAVILDGRNPDTIVLAPEDGLFEALLEPGDPVSAGEPGRPAVVPRPPRPAARADPGAARRRRRRDEGDPRHRAGRLRLRARRSDRPLRAPLASGRGMTAVEQTFSTTHCRFGVATTRRDAAGRDLQPLVGRGDARRRGGRPPAAHGDRRRLRAARRRRADPGARRARRRLVPVRPRRARAPRGDQGALGARGGRAARPAVAHACRCEHELAARGPARLRADRAVPRVG